VKAERNKDCQRGWRAPELQLRQHEADQCDGVFRFLETHLEDQPWPQNFCHISLVSLYKLA